MMKEERGEILTSQMNSAFANFLFRRSVGLLLYFKNNQIKTGSGSLVNIGSNYFIFTAAHNILNRDIKDIKIIETPGHAPHHISFSYGGDLFAGEAAGNYCTISGKEYLRPATPPIFLLEECLGSVDKLLALEDQPMYYGHFGKVESSHRLLKRFRHQLLRWNDIIKEEITKGDSNLSERCLESLLEKDPDLKTFEFMAPDTQMRERFFLSNSVRGYLGYLKENS